MIRFPKRYSPDFVFKYITDNPEAKPVNVDGDLIKMKSLRYRVFQKSCVCAKCGLRGTHMYKEKYRPEHPYHFNLYGINSRGDEILFTKGFIDPKSGKDPEDLSNRQTLCFECSRPKAHRA